MTAVSRVLAFGVVQVSPAVCGDPPGATLLAGSLPNPPSAASGLRPDAVLRSSSSSSSTATTKLPTAGLGLGYNVVEGYPTRPVVQLDEFTQLKQWVSPYTGVTYAIPDTVDFASTPSSCFMGAKTDFVSDKAVEEATVGDLVTAPSRPHLRVLAELIHYGLGRCDVFGVCVFVVPCVPGIRIWNRCQHRHSRHRRHRCDVFSDSGRRTGTWCVCDVQGRGIRETVQDGAIRLCFSVRQA